MPDGRAERRGPVSRFLARLLTGSASDFLSEVGRFGCRQHLTYFQARAGAWVLRRPLAQGHLSPWPARLSSILRLRPSKFVVVRLMGHFCPRPAKPESPIAEGVSASLRRPNGVPLDGRSHIPRCRSWWTIRAMRSLRDRVLRKRESGVFGCRQAS